MLSFACPSHALRRHVDESLWNASSWQLKGGIALCKGLEPKSNLFAHEVMGQEMGEEKAVGYLTGPSHALDVALGKPGAMSLAMNLNQETLDELRDVISSSSLRIYSTDDLVGVALGVVSRMSMQLPQVFQTASGSGDNARAALLTRSMNEMISLGDRIGGKKETFFWS